MEVSRFTLILLKLAILLNLVGTILNSVQVFRLSQTVRQSQADQLESIEYTQNLEQSNMSLLERMIRVEAKIDLLLPETADTLRERLERE